MSSFRWTPRLCLAAVCVLVVVLIGLAMWARPPTASAAVNVAAVVVTAGVVALCAPLALGGAACFGTRRSRLKGREGSSVAGGAGETLTSTVMALRGSMSFSGGRADSARILTPQELWEFEASFQEFPFIADLVESAQTAVEYKDLEHRVP